MKVRLTAALLGAAVLIGGCQSGDKGGYTDTVQGNYRTLASCFAQQPIEQPDDADDSQRLGNVAGLTTTAEDNRERNRPPSLHQITVNDSDSRTVVVDVGTATAGGYRVSFMGLTETTTEVRARPIGFPARFFWPEQVAPLVARCSGRIPS